MFKLNGQSGITVMSQSSAHRSSRLKCFPLQFFFSHYFCDTVYTLDSVIISRQNSQNVSGYLTLILCVSEIRGKRGDKEGSRGIKERGKQRLVGAGLGFFLWRQRCIIYRRWWRQAASDGAQQRRRAAPFSFVGLFPVGRLCAGWMAVFEETRAAIEPGVKAGTDSTALRHSNTTAPQCLSPLRPERKRKGRRESDRGWGGNSGSV